jgi:cyclic pyranopterin phosphate synthase
MAQTIDLIAGKTAIQPPPALLDAFDRTISYLRISVTDRCNLRCVYCMPPAGLPWIAKPDLLSFDEIVRVAMAGAALGLRSIRLTGGEPLLRPRIVDLVRALAAIPGVDDISLSTNGLLLAELAEPLACAGLRRVNVSLDTLRADRFEELALRPGLGRVLAGIEAALAAGLVPLKLNCVVMRGRNHDEIAAFAALTKHQPIAVRFIELMPVEKNVALQNDAYLSSDEVLECVRSVDELASVDGPKGNGPARYYAFSGAAGTIGVISPLSHEYCGTCNRVRLSADGRLRPCLFGDNQLDLRTLLRAGATQDEIAAQLRRAMLVKPERHHLKRGEAQSALAAFSQIGG